MADVFLQADRGRCRNQTLSTLDRSVVFITPSGLRRYLGAGDLAASRSIIICIIISITSIRLLIASDDVAPLSLFI
jgi:hypothetical protein